jgi:hypothetical protein
MKQRQLFAATVATLGMPLVLAQAGASGGGALPLRTQPLQFTGIEGTGAQGALPLRTAPLQYTGIAGR